MTNLQYNSVEAVLCSYAFGDLAASSTQNALKALGFKADLRGNSHLIDVWPLQGGDVVTVEV